MNKQPMDELLRDALRAKENPTPELNESILSRITMSEKKSRFLHKSKGIAVAAGFVFLFLVLGGTIFKDNVKATMERLFGPITESYVYGDKDRKKQAEEEVSKVGETIYKNGLAVTLGEVLVDANKVAFCIKVHSDERWGLPLTYANIVSHIYINGEEIVDTPSYTSWTADDNTQISVGEVALNTGMDVKGNVELQIQVSDICTTPAISDSWDFKTVVNVDKANSHTKKDLTTTTMKLSTGDMLTLHKVVCTSTDCKVYMTYEPKKERSSTEINLFLQGTDNLGERVLNDDCIVRKMREENKFEVIMSFTGGFDKKVKKLRLAPHWMNYEKHKYKKIGEEFTVVLA